MTKKLSNHGSTLRQQLQTYLEHLKVRNYSPHTMESYQERLLPFVIWCEDRGVMNAPQVSLAVLEGYQRSLAGYRKADGKRLAVNSQLNRLTAIRMLFRWLLKNHHILYNPAELLELPREEKRLPAQVLSEEETRNVLQAVDSRSITGLRNRTLLELLWSTGIRRMELGNLMLRDIDVRRGVVVVRQGKGNKDRVVPVGERALEWLARYLEHARPVLARRFDSGYVFISNKGSALSKASLTEIAGKAIREDGLVDKPGACHVFRHTMATQMLENGADIRYIQAMLGHEKLETTQVYTRVAIGHLQKVHKKTHPGECKRSKK